MKKRPFLLGILILLIATILFTQLSNRSSNELGTLGDVHEHADFKVIILGEELDFSKDIYQSTEDNLLNNFLHVHDNDGQVIHKHISGITISKFFQSLDMDFNSTCFKTETQSYCTDSEHQLFFLVNGKDNPEYGNYILNDLDKIVIQYGTEGNLTTTDRACIYSETCPERGSPPDEVTCGLGGCTA